MEKGACGPDASRLDRELHQRPDFGLDPDASCPISRAFARISIKTGFYVTRPKQTSAVLALVMLGLLLSPVYQCLFTPTVGILVCGGMALFVDGVSNLLPLPNRAQRKAPPAQHAVTKPDAAAPDELLPSLASLPADELRLIIDRLGPREFANFAQTSGALRALVDAQWSCLLDRFFHDDVSKPHARSQQERFQACFRPVAATKEDTESLILYFTL